MVSFPFQPDGLLLVFVWRVQKFSLCSGWRLLCLYLKGSFVAFLVDRFFLLLSECDSSVFWPLLLVENKVLVNFFDLQLKKGKEH